MMERAIYSGSRANRDRHEFVFIEFAIGPITRPSRPSPTGAQHVGNARTYLIAWLSARSNDAELALRIEDIDSPSGQARSRPKRFSTISAGSASTGMANPLCRPSGCRSMRTALCRLQQDELVYPCTCTRSDVAEAASAPHARARTAAPIRGHVPIAASPMRRIVGGPAVCLAVPRRRLAGLHRRVSRRNANRHQSARRRLRRLEIGGYAGLSACRRRR